MVSRLTPSAPGRPRKRQVQRVSDGRWAALEVLLLLEQGAQVQSALDSYLRVASLKPQDKGLCTELVYGFLRAEIRIDHLLHNLLRNPAKLPREMFLALGLAIYALVFLERIPPHATVDWTVGHVRRRFGESMARVANGALRTFVRLGDTPKLLGHYCPQGASPAAALYGEALFYSLPAWVVQLWDKAYGPDARRALSQRSLRAPYTGIRVNALSPHAYVLYHALLQQGEAQQCVTTQEKVAGQNAPCPPIESALSPSETSACVAEDFASAVPPDYAHAVGYSGVAFAPGRSPRSVANAPLSYWQQQGDISFQSAGSQCVIEALQPSTWPSPVWDMCAGQGGKTSILLEQGLVVALCSDVHLERLESFTRNMQRLASAFGVQSGAHGFGVPQDVSPGKGVNRKGEQSDAAPDGVAAKPLAAMSLYTAGRAQALQLVGTVSTAIGATVPMLDYPAPAGKKCGMAVDPNYYYDADDDVTGDSEAACLGNGQSVALYSDQNLELSLGQSPEQFPASSLEPPTTGNPYSDAPLVLPVVALVDGCSAPVNSWAGTICIDAPCSGLGILHRRPDIRRNRTKESLAELVDTQARLLDAAWQALQKGGGLVYLTCTVNPAENEGQIERLLQTYPNARLVRQWQTDAHHPWLEGMFGAYCVKV